MAEVTRGAGGEAGPSAGKWIDNPPPIMAPGFNMAEAPFVGGEPANRARIRKAARQIFIRDGFSKATINAIARSAEMSAANLYRHYRNKQAIGFAVACDTVTWRAQKLQQQLDAPMTSAEDRLRRVIETDVALTAAALRRTPQLVKLSEIFFTTQAGREVLAPLRRAYLDSMQDLVAHGIATGEYNLKPGEAREAARAALICLRYFSVPAAILSLGVDRVERDLGLALEIVVAALRTGAPLLDGAGHR